MKRGRAWTLWKALIVASGVAQTKAIEATQCWRIIDSVLSEQSRAPSNAEAPTSRSTRTPRRRRCAPSARGRLA